MNKKPEQTEATKEAFVQAFLRLNKKLPIEKISVRKLTETAGYNRTTFYNYFQDVYALREYIEEQICVELGQRMVRNLRRIGDEEQFVNVVTDTLAEYGDSVAVLLKNQGNQNIETYIKRPVIGLLKEQFGVDPEDVSADYRLDYMISGALSLAGRWAACGGSEGMSAGQLGGLMQDILSNGVLHGIVE